MFQFRLRAVLDFPARYNYSNQARRGLLYLLCSISSMTFFRISASLENGQVAAPPGQVFLLSSTGDLDVIFPFLRHQKDYGRLCVLEEPLVNGFTAMGRLISGLSMKKCFFGNQCESIPLPSFVEYCNPPLTASENLKTKDYELSILDSEASPYKRSSAPSQRLSSPLLYLSSSLILLSLICKIYCWN